MKKPFLQICNPGNVSVVSKALMDTNAPIAMHMTFNGINVGLSFVDLLSIPNWIITMSFLVGIAGFLILFVWLLFRNPVVVEKGRYRKRNLITKEGVTFVKGSIHVRFMGQTDNKA